MLEEKGRIQKSSCSNVEKKSDHELFERFSSGLCFVYPNCTFAVKDLALEVRQLHDIVINDTDSTW
jgi:hypothetical protein